MIVVADTSPINYLVLIREIELIPRLYTRVLIPREVLRELLHSQTPPSVRAWASQLPQWSEVRDVQSAPDASLAELDTGEREAIQLAVEAGADTLLMDEAEGRREALRRNLKVTGTVAVLEKAAQLGLVNFREALGRLDETNFRLSRPLREAFITRNP